MKYIGQTCNPLFIRINQHKLDIPNNISNNVEYLHFQVRDFHYITIKILNMHKSLNDRLLYESISIKSYNSLYHMNLIQMFSINHIIYTLMLLHLTNIEIIILS